MMRKFTVLAIAVLLWTAAAGQSAKQGAPSASELQQRRSSISRQITTVKNKLTRTKRREAVVTVQLNAAEERLDQARTRLSDVSQRLALSRGKLQQASQSLSTSDYRLNKHKQALAERLELIYQRGETGLLEILFQASSYGDLENRLYQLNQFISQDADLLDRYEQAREQRAAAAQDAADTTELVAQLREQAALSHAEAAERRAYTADLKRRISRQRMLWEQALAELEQNSREVEALLRRLQSLGISKQPFGRPFAGGLIRPVSGGVISGFGYRLHPIFRARKMHTGVDLRARYDTPIHAAAAGVVVHSGRWGGYGNCVIIDHGSGVATLYAHCSSLGVSAGREVKQGQVIAWVGSTGLSTGPHLHFEVRHNGRPVNPGL